MLKKLAKGFSLIEVMTAAAVVSGLGVAIYKLQLSALANSQQSVTKQVMLQYADELINTMYAHENFQDLNHINQMPGQVGGQSAYAETTYSVASLGVNCSTNVCNDSDWAKYNLYLWKIKLQTKANLPAANVHGIVCQDSTLSVPSENSPNCDGSGNLAIKIVWKSHLNNSVESSQLGNVNYVMLRVPQR